MDTGQYTDKKKLRREGLQKRDALPARERQEKSRMIQQRLLASEVFLQARQLLCYVHFRSEAETALVLEQALSMGKEVYCPKVCKKEMEFYRIFTTEELKPGAYGILEPEADETRLLRIEAVREALMIMPGAVFDRKGYRIGYGGGYYDRYLSRFTEKDEAPIKAAFLFSCQLIQSVPREEHDLAADLLVTEDAVMDVTAGTKNGK